MKCSLMYEDDENEFIKCLILYRSGNRKDSHSSNTASPMPRDGQITFFYNFLLNLFSLWFSQFVIEYDVKEVLCQQNCTKSSNFQVLLNDKIIAF